MKKGIFRIFCLTVGLLAMVGIIVSSADKLAKGIGITLSIFLMVFGVVITSEKGKQFISEQHEGEKEGSMGG